MADRPTDRPTDGRSRRELFKIESENQNDGVIYSDVDLRLPLIHIQHIANSEE
jgi:hypothetical protein